MSDKGGHLMSNIDLDKLDGIDFCADTLGTTLFTKRAAYIMLKDGWVEWLPGLCPCCLKLHKEVKDRSGFTTKLPSTGNNETV